MSDALILVGIGTVSAGLWLIYYPVVFIFIGIILMVLGWPRGGEN